MSAKELLHNLVETTTDVSVLLRELCIVALFCLLFFAPNTFKSLLTRIGISKVTTVFGDIDVTGAGGTVANLNRGLKDAIDGFQKMQSASGNSQENGDVGKVIDYLKNLQQEAETTDETIKTSIANQQAASEQTSPQTGKQPGWLYAGTVDREKLHWSGDHSKSVVPANLSPQFTANETFGVTSAAYLRAEVPSGDHSKGVVIGVVTANEQVRVIALPEWSPAISGGYFCWVKVQPL